MKKRFYNCLENEIFRRFFIGGGWLVLGSIFSRILGLSATVLAARILHVEQYGEYLFIQSTLGMLGSFAGLGMGVVATKFAAELHSRDPLKLGRILSTIRYATVAGGALITIICIWLASDIANKIISIPHLAGLFALGSASLFFLTLDGYQNSVLLGLEATKQSVYCSLFSGTASLPIIAALSWSLGLQGAVIGLVLTSLTQCIFSNWVLTTVLKSRNIVYGPVGLDLLFVLRDYAIPALLGGAMIAPVHWLCQVLLLKTTNGTVEMAVLGVGLQWFQAVYFLPLAFGRIALPVMTDILSRSEIKSAKFILISSVMANLVTSLPISIIIGLLSKSIMTFYAIDVEGSWIVLILMVGAATVSAACHPVGQVLVARGKIWYGWLMNLGWAAIFLGGTYFLVNSGALGVATALLIAYLIHSLWTFLWVWKDFSNHDSKKII